MPDSHCHCQWQWHSAPFFFFRGTVILKNPMGVCVSRQIIIPSEEWREGYGGLTVLSCRKDAVEECTCLLRVDGAEQLRLESRSLFFTTLGRPVAVSSLGEHTPPADLVRAGWLQFFLNREAYHDGEHQARSAGLLTQLDNVRETGTAADFEVCGLGPAFVIEGKPLHSGGALCVLCRAKVPTAEAAQALLAKLKVHGQSVVMRGAALRCFLLAGGEPERSSAEVSWVLYFSDVSALAKYKRGREYSQLDLSSYSVLYQEFPNCVHLVK